MPTVVVSPFVCFEILHDSKDKLMEKSPNVFLIHEIQKLSQYVCGWNEK